MGGAKMQKPVLIVCGAVTLLFLSACLSSGRERTSPLQVVASVDLKRYTGDWYEIARFPHRFQEGCVGSRATYSLRDDGMVTVLNQCYEGSFSGKLRTAKGKAWVVDEQTKAKLRVSFFWPFSGAYWIIDLGKDYEFAVVGHPDRTYLWILSRAKTMDEKTYREILGRLEVQGYDTARLIRSVQE
jgi:apolipoprotein D and lipocalin family protein